MYTLVIGGHDAFIDFHVVLRIAHELWRASTFKLAGRWFPALDASALGRDRLLIGFSSLGCAWCMVRSPPKALAGIEVHFSTGLFARCLLFSYGYMSRLLTPHVPGTDPSCPGY